MSFRIAPHNVIGWGQAWGATPTAGVVQSATADANYPVANLYDGQTSPVCKWASLGTDYYFDVALNVVPDGDFEQAAVPSSWVATGGTVARSSAVTAHKGSYHLALTPTGTGDASVVCDVTVKAGTYWKLSAATRGNTRTARFRVLDMERGGAYYLAADGTWTTTPTWLGSTSAAAWTATTVTELRIPTFADWGRREGVVRIELSNLGNGASTAAVYFDEVLLYPSGLDVVAFIGHSFPRLTRVRALTYADYWHGGASSTPWDDATGVMRSPTGWLLNTASPLSTPFVRLQVSLPNSGTAYRYPQVSELFLGRTVAMPRAVRFGLSTEWAEEQPRQRTRGGLWAQRDQQYPSRKYPITVDLSDASSQAEWVTVRDDVMLATGMGSSPCLFLPATTWEPELCMFGHLKDSLRLTPGEAGHTWDTEFEELPIPLV